MSSNDFDGRVFEVDEVIAVMRVVVDAKGGDFRYVDEEKGAFVPGEGCFYLPVSKINGVPLSPEDPRRTTGCIVGETLKLLGFTADQISAAVGTHPSGQPEASLLVFRLASDHGALFSQNATHVLEVAQLQQDRGKSWSEALESAIDALVDEEDEEDEYA